MQLGQPIIAWGILLNANQKNEDNIELSAFEINAIEQNQQLNFAQIAA